MALRTPTEFELQHISLGAYDPVKAHDYYLRTRKLHPRKKGAQTQGSPRSSQPPGSARAKQKHELEARITGLQKKLSELEQLIQVKEAALKRSQGSAKATAKKERAAKSKNKPKTAAEKAKAARENAKYRDKHKQTLKTKAKQANKAGGGKSPKAAGANKARELPIANLKALATKVRGQLAVAKQKLAAL